VTVRVKGGEQVVVRRWEAPARKNMVSVRVECG